MRYFKYHLIIIFSVIAVTLFAQNKYAVSINYTPVLNTSDFESVFGGKNGNKVKLDKEGLIREMEFIAMPNTVFEITETIPKKDYNIYKVTTNDYQYKGDFYIDSRFVRVSDSRQEDRWKIIPTKEEIIKNLNALEGYPYMWGGNEANGVSEMLTYYKPAENIDEATKNNWIIKGVDCSGLIYQSTGGTTPRNTSTLCTYGTGIEIEGLTAEEIAKKLQPLDIIVWSGHVVVVLDDKTTIESTPDYGVHKTDLLKRLTHVMEERTPVNDWKSTTGKRFVVRRWAE